MLKNTIIVIFAFILTVLGGCQTMSVMTYNIRLDIAVDGDNAWPYRRNALVALLKQHSPDIIGTQEGLPHQITYIAENLEEYAFIGQGRDGGKDGEFTAIFYKADKFLVTNESTFWLSETPDEKSMGWDAAYPRICTYGLFTHVQSGRKMWVVNTHLDNVGELARSNGVSLIMKRINTANT